MKKITAALLCIAVLALSLSITGCGNNDTFTAKNYFLENTEMQTLIIDVQDREISIKPSSDKQFHIDYFESEKEYYEISVSNNNELSMKLVYNKEWTDFIGTKPAEEYRKINIKIPTALLADLIITTTNEVISLSPITVTNSISLYSNGGNIEFEKINAGKAINLTAKNSNIKGTIIGSYDMFSIACEIKKGDCNLPVEKLDGEKSLKVNCNNGNTKIDFVKA